MSDTERQLIEVSWFLEYFYYIFCSVEMWARRNKTRKRQTSKNDTSSSRAFDQEPVGKQQN